MKRQAAALGLDLAPWRRVPDWGPPIALFAGAWAWAVRQARRV